MPDYSKGKIYRIVCDTSGEVYYGSTTQSLSVRLSGHKFRAKNNCTCRSIIDGGNYSIVLVEEYPCENKEQLERRERFYIENNVCVNKQVPTRTTKEYRDVTKDRKADYDKHYRENNKEMLNEKKHLYYQDHKEERAEKVVCECGRIVRRDALRRHKTRRQHQKYIKSLDHQS